MKRSHYNHNISPKQPTRNHPHQHATGLKQPPPQPQRTTARSPAVRRGRRPFPANSGGARTLFFPFPSPFSQFIRKDRGKNHRARGEGSNGRTLGDFKGGEGSEGPHRDVAVRWARARSGTWQSRSRPGLQGRRHASRTVGSRRLPFVQGNPK